MDINIAFPALSNYEVTSPQAVNYNCIAWAAGKDDAWWWPHPDYYWPQDVPLDASLEGFVELFRTLGYEVCDNDFLESGFTKVAIYAREEKCTHAARQLPDGTWTSKLGSNVDITHATLAELSGPIYGEVVCVMKREAVHT